MLARSGLKVDNDDKVSQSLSAAKLPCSVVHIFSGGISRVKFWLLLSNGLDRLCLVYAKSLPNRSINIVFMYGAIMGQLNCGAN